MEETAQDKQNQQNLPDALTALRHHTTASTPITYFNEESNSEVDDLPSATHVVLDGHRFPKAMLTRYKKSHYSQPTDCHSLESLVFVWLNRTLSFGDYIYASAQQKIPNVSFVELNPLLEYLKGNTDGAGSIIEIEDQAGEVGEKRVAEVEEAERKRQKTDENRMDLSMNDEIAVQRIQSREYTGRNRKTYLSEGSAKDFTNIQKIGIDIFYKNKIPASEAVSNPATKPDTRSRPNMSRPAPSSSKPGSVKPPIIIVPPNLSTLLTLHNVKSFLEDAHFEVPNANMKKPSSVQVKRKQEFAVGGSGRIKNFTCVVVDNVERFRSDDWDRVVAVFTNNAEWQFRDWKWKDPVSLFSHVRGFYVKYHDAPPPTPVSFWNVHMLNVDRNKRHLDQPVVIQFWTELEKWVLGNKPHLVTV